MPPEGGWLLSLFGLLLSSLLLLFSPAPIFVVFTMLGFLGAGGATVVIVEFPLAGRAGGIFFCELIY